MGWATQFQDRKILHFVEIAEGLAGVVTPYPGKVFGESTTVWGSERCRER